MARRILSVLVTLSLVLGLQVATPKVASAEDCPTYDLTKVFDEEFFPDVKWDTSSKPRTITWSPNAQSIKDVPIARPFTQDELGLLQISFDSWDVALDSIRFQRTEDPARADVIIGITPLQENGFWTVEVSEKTRVKGTIRISSTTPIILTREGFIEVASSEIGNLLGLGDIQHSMEGDSVMLDPDRPPFGEEALNDFDANLIRQFYGESTCKSQWPAALIKSQENWGIKKAKLAADALAEAQAKADAEAKAKAQAEADAQAKAKAEAEAKARAELANKKTTITCVQGKKTKKVTAVKPVCPKGFKKK